MTHLCIKPACGFECDQCSAAISEEDTFKYAIRYALLRQADPRFGMPIEWMRARTFDDAIDYELERRYNTHIPKS